jgi:transketolase C-terminal domain/subunit
MVYESLEAADRLSAEGVAAAVVNVSTLKPFDSRRCSSTLPGRERS